HPLLGDGKYGINRGERTKGYKHRALYAVRLRFDFGREGYLGYLSGREFQIDTNEVWFLRDFGKQGGRV
ncbi:MAG: RluA family pseudouridine synthase, partial [Clostridia bacterium]|nr:RluA family pseudouridine synthase [Clostridia bacterium]